MDEGEDFLETSVQFAAEEARKYVHYTLDHALPSLRVNLADSPLFRATSWDE